ncbi:hypothetical protein ACEZOD_003323 [Vibrio cholerae]|nr:hypothetical protein [Vibrio cholerae]
MAAPKKTTIFTPRSETKKIKFSIEIPNALHERLENIQEGLKLIDPDLQFQVEPLLVEYMEKLVKKAESDMENLQKSSSHPEPKPTENKTQEGVDSE